MSRQVNIHEAKTHFSKLIELAQAGEELVIAKSGRPVARLLPVAREPRRLGLLDGEIEVPEDFNAPLPEEVLATFLGRA